MSVTPQTPDPSPAGDAPEARIGRYEVIDRLGVGGMAEAFRARARGPGGYQRELVIKRILPHLAEDPDFVQSFVDEAKILGMLHHPNVVGVYDFGEDQGRHYLALEFLDGPSLADIIVRATRANEAIPVGVAAHIGREICTGLAAVHTLRGPTGQALGVIHRDVTPSNVMTTLNGAVKILDFGVAKIASSGKVTRHGQIKGKAGYFAPEQIAGGPIDARVDLFALGVLLHEMLCLEHLFYGEGGDLATIYRIMEMPIPPPATIRLDTPAELNRIVMKALERDRTNRYQNAMDMARELDAVAQAEGVRAEHVEAFVRRWRA